MKRVPAAQALFLTQLLIVATDGVLDGIHLLAFSFVASILLSESCYAWAVPLSLRRSNRFVRQSKTGPAPQSIVASVQQR